MVHGKIIDFTVDGYRHNLEKTKLLYPCVGFEVIKNIPTDNSFAILRHDIDMSPKQALELAVIESELGIRTTYTVLLNSEFYNPLEKGTREIIRRIESLGHDIGLHFDADWHKINTEEKLGDAILWESKILNDVLCLEGEKKIKMFSFHNTNNFTMSCQRSYYGGLINAYASKFQTNVKYTSDSNGYWIHNSWEELLHQGNRQIQILTHPVWWRKKDCEPAHKVCLELSQRSVNAWGSYKSLLESAKRLNKTGLNSASLILPKLLGVEGEKLLFLWLSGYQRESYLGLWAQFSAVSLNLLRDILFFEYSVPTPLINFLLENEEITSDPVGLLLIFRTKELKDFLQKDVISYKQLINQRREFKQVLNMIKSYDFSKNFDQLSEGLRVIFEFREELFGNNEIKLAPQFKPQSNQNFDSEGLLKLFKENQNEIGLSNDVLAILEKRLKMFSK